MYIYISIKLWRYFINFFGKVVNLFGYAIWAAAVKHRFNIISVIPWLKNSRYPISEILVARVCSNSRSQNLTTTPLSLKAILQVLIYKALYDKSYLGSKTTMTSGEWTCLISFATALLICSERGGSEKFKMKIYVSSGIRTHTPPVHDRKVAAP